MPDLIEDLQRNIINDAIPVTTILRQIKLAAAKLNQSLIEDWVENELSGYKNKTNKVPAYRKVHGVLKAFNPYNGWIPVQADEETTKLYNLQSIWQSLSEIESICKSSNTATAIIVLDSRVERFLQRNMEFERIIAEARRYENDIVASGVEASAYKNSIRELENLRDGSPTQSALSKAAQSFSETLMKAGGTAVATGLIQMAQQLF